MLTLRTGSEHRVFSASCLGFLDWRAILPPSKDDLRPILLVFGCSAQVFRPFVANIYERRPLHLWTQSGHADDSVTVTMLKSADYQLATQAIPGLEWREGDRIMRTDDMVIGTFYHPLFSIEPPPREEDSESVEFVVLPTKAQLEANVRSLDNRAIVTHLIRSGRTKVPADMWRVFGALAVLWAGLLGKRVAAPMVQTPEFFAHALYDAIEAGLVVSTNPLDLVRPASRGGFYSHWGDRAFPARDWALREYGLSRLGFGGPVLACQGKLSDVQDLLSQSLESYFQAAAAPVSGPVELPEGV